MNPTTVQSGRYRLSHNAGTFLKGAEFDLVRETTSDARFTVSLVRGAARLPLVIGLGDVWVYADGVDRNQVDPQGLCCALTGALEPVTDPK